MVEQRWEYCIFEFLKFNVDPAFNNAEDEQLAAAYRIKFCSPDGKVISKTIHKVTTKNLSPKSLENKDPFGSIIGVLGGAGWEMISNIELQDRMDLCTIFTTYFKRPAREGRSVEEPEITYIQ